MTAAYETTLAYLQSRYLTLEQLAAASGLPAARLEALIDGGCLPAHSHEGIFTLVVESKINGANPAGELRVRYFHRDVAELAAEADQLARELGLEPASRAIRARHAATVAEATGLEPGGEAHRDLADSVWGYWRDGTFGVCLQHVDVADMMRKAAAIEALEALLAEAEAGRPVDAAALDDALAGYAAVTGPFGPQERHLSTRARLYEPALALRETLRDRAA